MRNDSPLLCLGVDVAKARLGCMLQESSKGKLKSKGVANTAAGCRQLP
jgi:hypothetical protein